MRVPSTEYWAMVVLRWGSALLLVGMGAGLLLGHSRVPWEVGAALACLGGSVALLAVLLPTSSVVSSSGEGLRIRVRGTTILITPDAVLGLLVVSYSLLRAGPWLLLVSYLRNNNRQWVLLADQPSVLRPVAEWLRQSRRR